ncbi:MAG: GNAT family N-acetyltransferase [Nanoarchaeota archaeon]|nr:GNAT family N-acetyltransferase [Nanoarchaeota archaeon]
MTIRLGKFDINFLKKIEDYKKIHINPRDCICYTIYKNNKKVGVIGLYQKENNYFLKIGIHQNFRGQGVFGKALSLLIRKHKINKIYSTIALANKTSIVAHEKLGFRRISLKEEEDLKNKGSLLKRNIRMVKLCQRK